MKSKEVQARECWDEAYRLKAEADELENRVELLRAESDRAFRVGGDLWDEFKAEKALERKGE